MNTRERGKDLSSKEEDLITRNKKKFKDGDADFSGSTSGPISYADLEIIDGGIIESACSPVSFKNAVLRQDQDGTHVMTVENNPDSGDTTDKAMCDQAQEMRIPQQTPPLPQQDFSMTESSFGKDPNGDEACLIVSIPKQERERMGRPLNNTLIIKLLGMSIGFNFLERKLKELWAPKGEIEIIDLPYDYYFVKFTHEDDYDFALCGGPWIILDHYLTVRKWFSKFDPETDKINSISVWIRFPKLAFDLFDFKFLTSFGNSIGKTIKIDTTTTRQARGKFARMCVEIDLSKPLISKYKLDGKKYYIEYESIHMICFECGKYGHLTDKCPSNPVNVESATENPVQEMEAKDDAKFGPWMIVKKTRRARKAKAQNNAAGEKQVKAHMGAQQQEIKSHKERGESSSFRILEGITNEDEDTTIGSGSDEDMGGQKVKKKSKIKKESQL